MRFAASFVIVGKHEKLEGLADSEEALRITVYTLKRVKDVFERLSEVTCREGLCKLVVLIAFVLIDIVVLLFEIALEVVAALLSLESVRPDALKDTSYRVESIYENLITMDSWNAEALTTINRNIMNQHTEMRGHLQDRHQLMVNDIVDVLETVRNEIGNQIAESNASLGKVCARTNRVLTTEVDPSPVEMTIKEIEELWTEDVKRINKMDANIGRMADKMEEIEAKIEWIDVNMEVFQAKMEGVENMLKMMMTMLEDAGYSSSL